MMNIAAEKAGIMDDKKWLYEDADLSYELEMEKDPAFQAGLLIGPDGEIQKPKKKKSAKGKTMRRQAEKTGFLPLLFRKQQDFLLKTGVCHTVL